MQNIFVVAVVVIIEVVVVVVVGSVARLPHKPVYSIVQHPTQPLSCPTHTHYAKNHNHHTFCHYQPPLLPT